MGHQDLRQRLKDRPCIGTFVKLPRPEVADVLSLAGFDFVIVDMEHGQISEIEARTLILACISVELAAVVRLPDATPGLVNRLLEVGAVGIQMPKVRTCADAERLRAMTRFPPEGIRSIGFANAWAGYGAIPMETVVAEANERCLAVGMFETKEIEKPIEETSKHIDVAFIGPSDLAIEFGLPFEHAAVRTHVESIEEACRRTNTVLGFPARNPEQAQALIGRGYRYIVLSNDVAMLSGAAKQLMQSLPKVKNAG